MKVTVGDDDGNYMTISDPAVGFSPDVLDHWCSKAVNALLIIRLAASEADDSAVEDDGSKGG